MGTSSRFESGSLHCFFFNSLSSIIHVSKTVPVYIETVDLLLTDLFNFFDKASRTCHVASPSRGGTLNRRARLTDGSSRFFCMSDKLVAATCSKIPPFPDVSLGHRQRDIWPTHRGWERQTNPVGYNNRHAPKCNRLNKSRAPWGPP